MNPTGRFTNRVDFYVKHRPGYPDAAFTLLRDALPQGCTVADIGSGTGISSRWLLANGVGRVFAVEPNAAMRDSAGPAVAGYVAVDGTAEATTLNSASVDAVVCATAFHWFRVDECRREFQRILRPGGHVILMWNIRKREASPLQQGYEELIAEFATDYRPQWDHQSSTIVDEFFAGAPYRQASVPNAQHLDWQGFLGRALSASYMPLDNPDLIERLRSIFAAAVQSDGCIDFEYETKLYWGVCGGASSSNR